MRTLSLSGLDSWLYLLFFLRFFFLLAANNKRRGGSLSAPYGTGQTSVLLPPGGNLPKAVAK